MHHVRLPHWLHGHGVQRSPDAVADALSFVVVFVVVAILTWLVFGELLGVNPGVW
jgi:hypothetical protein